MKKIKFITYILIITTSFLYSKNIDQAFNFYYDGKYKQASYLFEYFAKRGDVRAALYLGNMYFDGLGVIKNRKKSFYYYKKAALKNNKSAQLKLSLLYLNGSGVTKSVKKSNYWQKKAKEKSYAKAYFQFAKIAEGKKNYKKAFEWYKKASKLSYPLATYNMGLCYLNGIGVRKNYKKAKVYLRNAYFDGVAKAKYWIDKYNLKSY